MGWEEQGIIFGICSLCGMLVGIGADGYRAWQSAVRYRRTTVIMLDLFLWCVLAVLVWSLMLVLNGGEIRLYVFLALLTGYLIYRRMAGTHITGAWLWCARTICRIYRCVRRVINTLCLPLRWGLRTARRIMRRLTMMRKSPPDEKS